MTERETGPYLRTQLPQPSGRFLELGAYDGATNSLAAPFVSAGWGGLRIEANPAQFVKLLSLPSRSPVSLLCAAVVAEEGAAAPGPFWFSEALPEVSTAVASWRDKPWCQGARYREIGVGRVSVAELLRYYGADWQLVCIDIEGASIPVFHAFPWAAMPSVKLICVEANPHEITIPPGFEVICSESPNVIMRRAA